MDEIYLRLFSRRPSAEERELGLGFLKGQRQSSQLRVALTNYCLALLNTNEFIYID